MRLGFHGKLGLCFLLLMVFSFLVQSYLIYSLEKSFLLSSLISLLIMLPFAYFLARVLSRPVSEIAQKAAQLISSQPGKETRADLDAEPEKLSKAIDEMGMQLKAKIEEISKEKDYLQTLLRGIMEGVLVLDARGRIVMVNDALRQLLSLPLQVEDRTPLEIIRNAELERALRQVLQEDENTTLELTLPSPEGKTFEVNVVAIPPSPEGTATEDEGRRGVIAIFHDITRLKELEKIRRDFVANVSHELRTPLTTIKGYAETLLEGALKEEVAAQFVQVIKRHSDRLAKIVEELLMLSKIESREFQFKTEPISISDLIADVLDFLREPCNKKRLSVSYDPPPIPLFVQGDRHYLEQVFMNLLDNAIKYGREEGKVTISVIEKDHHAVEISVRDNGIGIPKEDLGRIFERFYRVDKGRSQELGGTGLGLSIVKHIVQAHGGKVWAESTPGKGSTFYVTLPLHRK